MWTVTSDGSSLKITNLDEPLILTTYNINQKVDPEPGSSLGPSQIVENEPSPPKEGHY